MIRTISKTHSGPRTDSSSFRHPYLSPSELHKGCRLGIDSYADTSCAGAHAWVIEFVEGTKVSAQGFASSQGPIEDLTVAHVAYAYDTPTGETIILEVNNSLYLGHLMDGSLLNPIQCMEHGIQIDTRPRKFYPQDDGVQSVRIPSLECVIPVDYHGPLPYLPIRRPTADEMERCRHFAITSREHWDPYALGQLSMHAVDTSFEKEADDLKYLLGCYCPTSEFFMHFHMSSMICAQHTLIPDANHNYRTSYAIRTKHRANSTTPEELAKLWGVGLKTCARTLEATTHDIVRTTGALTRRFRTDRAQMRYKQLGTHFGHFSVDTLKSNVKSIRGYVCGNVYTNRCGFKKFYPMSNFGGLESRSTLMHFIQGVGIPSSLHSDNHGNFSGGPFAKEVQKYGIQHTFIEPYSPWQNPAEGGIREVKRLAYRWMRLTSSPVTLWCFAFELAADILSLCVTTHYVRRGRTPYEIVFGYTPDISEYVTFGWYQWCYFWDEHTKEKRLGRWLGPAHRVGQALCYWVLNDRGEYLARSSVVPVPDSDFSVDSIKTQMKDYDDNIVTRIGNARQPNHDAQHPEHVYYHAFGDDPSIDETTEPYDSELVDVSLPQTDETFEELDKYIGARVVVPGRDRETMVLAEVKRKKRDVHGDVIGRAHSNPILDTHIYELETPDGYVQEYTTNQLVEHLHSQVDSDGFDYGLLDEIVDHRKGESAVPAAEGHVDIKSGQTLISRPVITTAGWDLQVRWRDGSCNWVPLSLIKESNPVEVAEYAIAQRIHKEPAFNWWVHKLLRKRDRIISKMKSRCRKPKMKFGIEVPETADEALALDEKNGDTFWKDAIAKEYENSSMAFDVQEEGEGAPVGWKKITCHLVFDVKMDLTRKARYVAGGHLTSAPPSLTYASVVSRDSVRIAFMLAALNDLDILTGDIRNAYLHAPSREKNYFIAGSEWGDRKGRTVLIVRALYGMKTSGAAWRAFLAEYLNKEMGYTESLADRDVWMKPKCHSDGRTYYSYIICYVDDLLLIDANPKDIMDKIQQRFPVKKESIVEPGIYLGAQCGTTIFQDANGKDRKVWTMSSDQYVKESVKNVKARLKESGFQYNKQLSSVEYSPKQPFSSLSYQPELDTTTACNSEEHTYFQNLIGILRWIVELGRIDIHYEVAVLSKYLASPRTGHLVQCLHIFKYLDVHRDNKLAFDPAYLDIPNPTERSREMLKDEMKMLYPDATEELSPNAPEPRGLPVQLNAFVDADHAGDKITRRSHTGILIYANMAPITWYSKKQTSIETSTFGSEFVALKTAAEMIISLRYKLRMFGVPLEGPANVMCDNESVYNSVSRVDSRLKKKSNSICYHKVRECVAAGILVVHKESTDTNHADILTKSLPASKRLFLRRLIMID